MKVWLVYKAYPYEGATLLGVFDSLEKANNCVTEKVKTEWEPENWKLDKTYENGCIRWSDYDEIYSEEHDVE